MSVHPNDAEGELYCQPSDVARFVKPRVPNQPGERALADDFRDSDHADGETRPTRAQVIKHIQGASTRIDRKTQQSWRANTVSNETHDHRGLYYWLSGHPLKLMKKNLRPLDGSKGDKLEVWDGNEWEDWLQIDSFEQGRDGDYWIDGPNGLLWVYERAILRPHPKFRITYRYGYDHVPADVREAVAKRAAADIITSDFGGMIVPGNNQGENADPARMAELWREDFREVCQDCKKVSFI